jgi:hypothetical protein
MTLQAEVEVHPVQMDEIQVRVRLISTVATKVKTGEPLHGAAREGRFAVGPIRKPVAPLFQDWPSQVQGWLDVLAMKDLDAKAVHELSVKAFEIIRKITGVRMRSDDLIDIDRNDGAITADELVLQGLDRPNEPLVIDCFMGDGDTDE